MQTSITSTRRRARRARVAKTITTDAVATSGKLDAASLPGGSGITELFGLAVTKTAADKIFAGKVKAIAKTTDHNFAGQLVLMLVKGQAVGEVEFGERLDSKTWAVKTTKIFDRPKATNVPEAAEGVVGGVRVLERRKATSIDEPVTKQRARAYNPSRVVDRVLLSDVRTLAQWGEEVALKKALAEVKRRGLEVERPDKLELAPDSEIETFATVELVAAHQAIHVNKGWSSEDMVGTHARIVAELADRGVPHPEPPPGLDAQSVVFEPARVAVLKSAAEEALGEIVAAVERYPVLVHKRVEGRPVTVSKAKDQVKVVAEDGADLTAEVPAVVETIRALKSEAVELEGVLEPWHGGEVFQVQDLSYDGRDLRDWPVSKRLERLAELGIPQATSAIPSLTAPVNELPPLEATTAETLERAIRVVKRLPGSVGAVVKPAESVDPGEWLELEAEPVTKLESKGPQKFVLWANQLLVGDRAGKLAERWILDSTDVETTEQIAKRAAPVPKDALSAGVGGVTDHGEVETGAVKPWLREYFLRGQTTGNRLLIRKLTFGELQKAQHSYTQCMACKAAPEIDVLWADGRGRAWFCKGCYPKWLHKGGGSKDLEVIGTKAIIGGRAPAKYSDRHNRVTTTKAAEPHPLGGWLVVRAKDPTPSVLTGEAVTKRWIPPLGVSALPEVVAEQVPTELAYWRAQTLAEARELRDQLVSKIDTKEIELDLTTVYTAKPSNPITEVSTNDTEGTADLFVPIAKIDTDRQIVTGIVLEPGEVDAQNDTVSDEVIERASINFLSRYNSETQLGLMHKAFGDIGLQLAASWVALTNQTLGKKKVKRGSWLMSMKVIDSKLWERVKKGEFTGFSIGGVAKVR